MKKKLFLFSLMAVIFSCLFAISAFALETTYDELTYTLTEGETEAENTAVIKSHLQKSFEKTDKIIPTYVEYEGEKYYVTALGSEAFRQTNITSVAFDADSRVSAFGWYAFQGCTSLTSVEMPLTLVTLDECMFQDCTSLTSIYPEGATPVQNAIILPNSITSIGVCAFRNVDPIKYIKLSSNLETLGVESLRDNELLQYVDYNNCKITGTIGKYEFYNNSSLITVSLPNGLTSLNGDRIFDGATKIEVLYLPDGLKQIGSFKSLNSLYFTDEPFSIDWYDGIFDDDDWNGQKPAKPDVYYFPSGLESFGEAFNGCKGLNDTVVFPAGVTAISHQYTFYNVSGKNFVFLGEVTSFLQNSNAKSNYYFIDADVTEKTLTITGNGNYNMNYHSASEVTHLYSPRNSEITPATCYSNETGIKRCFCNAEISRGEVENSMLAHSYVEDFDCTVGNKCKEFENCASQLPAEASAHSEKHTVVYAKGFTSEGVHTVLCENANCTAINDEITLEAIFGTTGGYSIDGNGGLTGGWTVNTDNFNLYNTYNEKDITFGILMVNPSHLASKQFMVNGSVNLAEGNRGALMVEQENVEYSSFKFSINGFNTTELKGLELVITAYVLVDGQLAEYIQDANTVCKVNTLEYEDGTLYTINYTTASSKLSVAEVDAILPTNKENA